MYQRSHLPAPTLGLEEFHSALNCYPTIGQRLPPLHRYRPEINLRKIHLTHIDPDTIYTGDLTVLGTEKWVGAGYIMQ